MNNWKNLPPVSALRALSAYAEEGSMTRAGAALNVTHAAVSQQLRNLERHLGVSLFEGSGRAMALTPQGRLLAEACTDGFGAMSRAVAELTGSEAERPLQISTTPSFAARWLMPRLGDFTARHPEINLMLNPSTQLVKLAPGGCDLAIRFGDGDWPGLVSEPLIASPLVVVAAPSLVGGRAVSSPREFCDLPWLKEIGVSEGSGWLEQTRADTDTPGPVIEVPGNLMLDGARNGQGIVATARIMVEDDLATGRLKLIYQDPGTWVYHLVRLPGVERPAARKFAAWLRRTAQG